jgi:antirestriction protein
MLDTRTLSGERTELKQQILDSFLENFPHYEDITNTFEDICFEEEEIQSWKEDWLDEIVTITDIEKLEDEVGSEFDYGVTLIDEDDFEEYCEELVSDIGDLPRDLPSYISNNIDWSGVADDLRVDYSAVNFRGTTYLFR